MEATLSSREACERLGVTLRLLYRLIDEGQLPAYKVGRKELRLRAYDIDRFGAGPGLGGVREPRRPWPPTRPSQACRIGIYPSAGDGAGRTRWAYRFGLGRRY